MKHYRVTALSICFKVENRRLRTVALTAHAMVGDKENFLNIGFDAYCSKPYELEKITELVKRFDDELNNENQDTSN